MPTITLPLPPFPAAQPPGAIVIDFAGAAYGRPRLRAGLVVPVQLVTAQRGGVRLRLGWASRAGLVAPIRPSGQLRRGCGLLLSWQVPLRGACQLPIWPASGLRGGSTLPVSMPAPLRAGNHLPVALVEPRRSGCLLPVSLPARDHLRAACGLPVSASGDTVFTKDDFSCYAQGQKIGLTAISLTANEDSYAITGTITAGDRGGWLLLTQGAVVILTTPAGEFNLIVTGPASARSIDGASYTEGFTADIASPAARLDAPIASASTETFDPGMASAIAAGLAARGGVSLTWQSIDWYVPADTLFANGETPLTVLRKLAAACGAIMQSAPDGTLVVRPRYPVSVPRWADTIPDYTLPVDDMASSVSYNPDYRDGYNAFLVGNADAATDGLTLEEVEVSPTRKRILLREVPLTTAGFTLYCSRPQVAMTWVGLQSETIERELVEFVAGTGRSRYPIYSLDGIEWGSIQLGALTFAEDGTLTAEVDGQSIAYITYITQYREWRADDMTAEDAQFWVE